MRSIWCITDVKQSSGVVLPMALKAVLMEKVSKTDD